MGKMIDGVLYGFTQPICFPCWSVENPGRLPTRVRHDEARMCGHCGLLSGAGIYIRRDPSLLRFPRPEPEEECSQSDEHFCTPDCEHE